jgi:hypothetical protein
VIVIKSEPKNTAPTPSMLNNFATSLAPSDSSIDEK